MPVTTASASLLTQVLLLLGLLLLRLPPAAPAAPAAPALLLLLLLLLPLPLLLLLLLLLLLILLLLLLLLLMLRLLLIRQVSNVTFTTVTARPVSRELCQLRRWRIARKPWQHAQALLCLLSVSDMIKSSSKQRFRFSVLVTLVAHF